MSTYVSRRVLRRLINDQRDLILELRRTIAAQASALDVLTTSAEEHIETAKVWRGLALNTADFFTAMKEGGQ